MLHTFIDGILHLIVYRIAQILFVAFLLTVLGVGAYLFSGFFGKRIPEDLPTNSPEPPESDFNSPE